MLNETPLYSLTIWKTPGASAPVPAVSESPSAATTRTSPGRRRWTEVGTEGDGERSRQGKVDRPDAH